MWAATDVIWVHKLSKCYKKNEVKPMEGPKVEDVEDTVPAHFG